MNYAPAPIETTHAGLEYDWDNNCVDNLYNQPYATGTSTSGGVPECTNWWTWTYDNCEDGEACNEEEGQSPSNHWAYLEIDDDEMGCPFSCTEFTHYYQVEAEIWFCPYVPTDPTATPSGPTPTPFTSAKVGEVTFTKGVNSVTADLVMEDTYQHAKAVVECDDIMWIPSRVEYEWGDVCDDCTDLAKGAAASKFAVTVRCCTSGSK